MVVVVEEAEEAIDIRAPVRKCREALPVSVLLDLIRIPVVP